MSLDDASPTEYFGPDAVSWVHPVTGKQHSLSPAEYERAEAAKERHFQELESVGHNGRCSVERTGRCICEYLAQWDPETMVVPDPDSDEPIVYEKDTRLVPLSSDGHPLAGNGYDDLFTLGNAGEVIPLDQLKEITDARALARAENLAIQESHRADQWRSTAVLMLLTVLCLVLGVTGRELGWY